MIELTRRQALPVLAATLSGSSPASASVDPTRIARLARGFNLPDLVPDTRPNPVDRRQLTSFRTMGMSHIRLPIHAEHLMPRFAGSATMAAALDDLRRALDMLLEIGFAATVDMHPGADLPRLYQKDPAGALAALSEGWSALAQSLSPYPSSRVFVELLNEPPTSDEIWRHHAAGLVKVLRPLLPDTTFITGPAPYQRVEALAAWPKIDDDNIVYAFHYYDPMAFTHQGATWMPNDPLALLEGVPFPATLHDPRIAQALRTLRGAGDTAFAASLEQSLSTPWTPQRIAMQFAPLADWSRTRRVPVILNEFGVLRFKAAPADRIHWLSSVRKAAETYGFGWAHWDYDTGFGLLDDGKVDDATLAALLKS